MTSNQNKYTCLVDAGGQISSMPLEHAKELGLEIFDEYGNIVKTTSTKKKSRYDAKHRIKDSSKLLRRMTLWVYKNSLKILKINMRY